MGLLLVACSTPKKTVTMKPPVFDTQGHRGARGLLPENTIPAMLKAIDLGVHTLETDVVISQDEQVVLSHEPFFNHDITTRPDGSFVTAAEEKSLNMYRMPYATVRSYDVGKRGNPRFPMQQKMEAYKPLLGEMIDAVETYCKEQNKSLPYYNIETKSQIQTDEIYHPAPGPFVELLVAVIRNHQIMDRVIIQSFDPRTLQYLHKTHPGIKSALLVEDASKNFSVRLKELGFVPTVYSPHYSLVTTLLVQQCKELGMKLIPWTVNELSKMKEFKKMGVDGIISDYPNLFSQL